MLGFDGEPGFYKIMKEKFQESQRFFSLTKNQTLHHSALVRLL